MTLTHCAPAAANTTPSAADKARTPLRLSAEQIVARNVAARGGLDGWRKVKTMIWIGHVESARAPIPSLGFVLEQARPNKTRFQLIANNLRSTRVFDGAHGWKVGPAPGRRPDVQPYTLEELRFAQAAPGLDGPLIDYAAKGSSVTLDGIEDVDGHKAYRLNVQLASGERDQVWVDAGSFLDVRYDRPAEAADGTRHTVTVYHLQYKEFEHLKIPSLIVTRRAPDRPPDRMVVERIALNAPLDDHIFDSPAKEQRRSGPTPGASIHGMAPLAPDAAGASQRSQPTAE